MKPDSKVLPTLFPPKRIAAADIEGTPPELGQYRRDFGGRDWTEVPSRIYHNHSDAYSLMEPKTLVHYLGGFLNEALTDSGSLAGEMLIYHAGTPRILNLTKLLSAEQVSFLIATIDYILLTDSYFGIHDAVAYDQIRPQMLGEN